MSVTLRKTLVGPPGFEPGTSCTPSKRASQAAPRPENFSLAQGCYSTVCFSCLRSATMVTSMS